MVILLILSMVFKVDLTQLAGGGGGVGTQSSPAPLSAESNERQEFVTAIKGSTEDVWTQIFRQHGQTYRPAKLVNYRDQIAFESVRGVADAAMGPFYLPAEETIYLDTSFFDQMKRELGGGGDFAYAYVIAHEVGHHVQHLLGYTTKVHSQKGRIPEREFNRLSVRLELQADYLAGVWAHHADRTMRAEQGVGLLEDGDIEEAMRAAKAIGDDALQRKARGQVVPDSFTHGTSDQRLRWFTKGFRSGDIREGNTFEVPYDQL